MKNYHIIYIFFCLCFLTSCKNNQKSQSKEFHKKEDRVLKDTRVNTSGIKGYFADTELINDSEEK